MAKDSGGNPIAGIAAADICATFNGGTVAQYFSGPGADSIAADPLWSGGAAGGCPAVRCIQADAPTDATGTTFITWIGHQASDPPGMGFRDATRKWGGYDSDIPIFVLGVRLQGKLTSGSPLGSYTAHVKNFDSEGSYSPILDWAERVSNPTDRNPVLAAIGGTYKYKLDFDNDGAVTNPTDINMFDAHITPNDHTCKFPNPIASVAPTILSTSAKPHGRAVNLAPNPMNPVATLAFSIRTPGSVSVRIYDVAGRLVRTVLSGQFFGAGDHSVVLDGRGDGGGQLGSGVYFYRIETTDGSVNGRFVVAR